ncbi:MAG TPA: hypothetical protein VJZ49_15395 [Syntrophales bacterium]|nr:hypothetical protein [Syntrophales bacterium]
MGKQEFISKALELTKKYAELHAEGCIGVSSFSIHLDSEALFRLFSRGDCRKTFHDEAWPTRYEILAAGVNFMCLTSEPWEAGEEPGKLNAHVTEPMRSILNAFAGNKL